LFAFQLIEKPLKRFGFSIFADKHDTAAEIVQDDSQIVVAFSQRDFVNGQDTQPVIVGLPEIAFEVVFVDGFYRFPIQAQMIGNV
jgi:hypothetical protein